MSGFVVNVSGMFSAPEERALNIRAPSWLIRNNFTYWPLFSTTMVVFLTFAFIGGRL